MQEILQNIDVLINNLLTSLGMYGPVLGCILILVESIIPVLPISVFITLNFYAFGTLLGFFMSYILTVIGCNLAFYISRKLLRNRIEYLEKRHDKNKIIKLIKKFSNIKLKHLAILMAFPFTPAFAINIAAGISSMKHEKFLIASLIAKPFMVYFWGYIGVTLLQSFAHPEYFIKIIILVALAYALSVIVNKKFDID